MTKGTFDKETLRAAFDRLRDACEDRPFDPDLAWRGIELAAKFCLTGEAIKRVEGLPRDRRERFTDLTKALAKARSELERITRSDQLTGQLGDACRQIGIEPGRIENVLDGIATMETAARMAGEKNNTKPGRPEGSQVPPHAVYALEMVYRNTTRREPTTTREGPFAQFVYECLAGFGYTLENDAVDKLIKKARRLRPTAA